MVEDAIKCQFHMQKHGEKVSFSFLKENHYSNLEI